MKLPNLHDRKTQLALGGAGAVAGYALYRKHVANAAGTATNAAGTSVGSITDPVASDAFGASSLENSIVGDLQPQIDNLSSQLSGLKAASPKPGPAGPAGPPGKPGKPGTPAKPTTVKAKAPLPKINSAAYPISVPASGLPGDALALLGTVDSAHVYTGHNIGGGAPVYALLPGAKTAVQDFNWKNLPGGTRIETLSKFKAYISSAVTKVKH